MMLTLYLLHGDLRFSSLGNSENCDVIGRHRVMERESQLRGPQSFTY